MPDSIVAASARQFRELSITRYTTRRNATPARIQAPPKPGTIFQLPLDILLFLIDNHLSADSRLRLSHTCRDLRVLATYDWPREIGGFAHPNKGTFCEAFANISLDHWLCYACINMHRVDQTHTTDIPIREPQGCKQGDRYIERAASNHHGGSHVGLNHVQAALKYHHSSDLDEAHAKYFKALMKTVTRTMNYPVESSSPVLTEGYKAHCDIIGDRFLLYEHWEYTPMGTNPRFNQGPIPLHRRRFWPEGLQSRACLHMDGAGGLIRDEHLEPQDILYLTPLQRDIIDILNAQQPGMRKFSCKKCPTDCKVTFKVDADGNKSFHIQTWKNLGKLQEGFRPSFEWLASTGGSCRLKPHELVPWNSWHLYNLGRDKPVPRMVEEVILEFLAGL